MWTPLQVKKEAVRVLFTSSSLPKLVRTVRLAVSAFKDTFNLHFSTFTFQNTKYGNHVATWCSPVVARCEWLSWLLRILSNFEVWKSLSDDLMCQNGGEF